MARPQDPAEDYPGGGSQLRTRGLNGPDSGDVQALGLDLRYVSVAYTHAPTDPRVRRHCESFLRRGWKVYQLGLGEQQERRVGRQGKLVLLRWPRRRYRGGRLIRYLWSYVSFFFWVRRVLARLGQDRPIAIVQVNNVPNFLIWAASAAHSRGSRLVLDIHDPEPELFLSKFRGRRWAQWGARVLALEERYAARSADQVLCVHEQHRAVSVGHGVDAAKLRVVVNHPDQDLFALRPPRAAAPFVGYHGTVAARMGLDVVLRGVAMARADWPALRGAIWGDGDAVASLVALRDALGLTEVVECTGQRFRLEELLAKLDGLGLGIVPVRRDSFTDIVLPTKLLEYVRLGIPVAVSWTPTIAQYFPNDTVYFIHRLDAEAVAQVIRQALCAPEEARARAQRAQRLPVARSWQQNEQAYVDILCGE